MPRKRRRNWKIGRDCKINRKNLAQRSQHLAPHTLAQELAQLNPGRPCPIYITHTKPSETQLIVEQVRRFDAITHPGSAEPHDISWLQAGQEFEV